MFIAAAIAVKPPVPVAPRLAQSSPAARPVGGDAGLTLFEAQQRQECLEPAREGSTVRRPASGIVQSGRDERWLTGVNGDDGEVAFRLVQDVLDVAEVEVTLLS